MEPINIKESPGGVSFFVRVLPRSSRNEIVGTSGGILKIKLTAPPVEGAANDALVKFLSEKLGVSKSRIAILAGQTGRSKTVSVSGIKKEDLSRILG
ncbi:MAG: DUF167 domain-containing protein [Nitrospirota bacterium]